MTPFRIEAADPIDPDDGTRRAIAGGWLRRDDPCDHGGCFPVEPADCGSGCACHDDQREAVGIEMVKRAGREAWQIHQQRGEQQP